MISIEKNTKTSFKKKSSSNDYQKEEYEDQLHKNAKILNYIEICVISCSFHLYL